MSSGNFAFWDAIETVLNVYLRPYFNAILYCVICCVGVLIPLNLWDRVDSRVSRRISRAIRRNDFIEAIQLINTWPNYVNSFDSDGYTPFLTACAVGSTLLVKILLAKGADLSLKTKAHEGPVYLLTMYYIQHPQVSDASCLRELYYANADLNEVNGKGLTPLQAAVMYGHKGLVRWLLMKQANINVNPHPLEIADAQGHQEVAYFIYLWERSHGLVPRVENRESDELSCD